MLAVQDLAEDPTNLTIVNQVVQVEVMETSSQKEDLSMEEEIKETITLKEDITMNMIEIKESIMMEEDIIDLVTTVCFTAWKKEKQMVFVFIGIEVSASLKTDVCFSMLNLLTVIFKINVAEKWRGANISIGMWCVMNIF